MRYHYFWVRRWQPSFTPELDDDERDLYDGEHPYCLPAVLEMLDSGIIALDHILYAARASREIPPERLMEAFGCLGKSLVLSAIGVWNRVLNLEWQREDVLVRPDRICCGLEDHARPSGWKCTRRIGCRTAYPLGLLALQCEQVRVFRGLRILRKFGATVHGVLTDGIYFDTLQMEAEEREFRACGSELTWYETQEIAKISRQCVRAQLEDRLAGERYKHLERRTAEQLKRFGLSPSDTLNGAELPVYKIFEPEKAQCPAQERVHLEQSRDFPVARPWTTLAETDHERRDRLVAEARPMQRLFRQLHPQRRHFPEGVLRLIAEFVGDDAPGFGPGDMSSDHFAKLADLLIHNGGGMVLGPGGVGKTTLVTGRTEKLADGTEVKIPGLIARWKRREPDAKFVTTAMMHVAARLLPGGRTLAHKLNRLQYGGAGLSKTVFVIDEISQIPLSAWSRIGEWYSLGARFVLLGDFYQFLPIKDQWADSEVSVEHADILRQLARALRIETDGAAPQPGPEALPGLHLALPGHQGRGPGSAGAAHRAAARRVPVARREPGAGPGGLARQADPPQRLLQPEARQDARRRLRALRRRGDAQQLPGPGHVGAPRPAAAGLLQVRRQDRQRRVVRREVRRATRAWWWRCTPPSGGRAWTPRARRSTRRSWRR
jgi:hypothetical protein